MKNLLNVSEIKVEFKPKFKLSECPQITNSKDAYEILMQVWDKGLMSFLEEFKVILLNNANRVLGIVDIAMGGKDSVLVDMRVIFSIALKASASKIILAHNHPSGKLLDVEVCDHLIVGGEGYYSLKDEGYF